MLDKVDAWQVFWSILIALVSYISIMITMFRKELKEVKKETSQRVLIVMCDKYRTECEEDCTKFRQERQKYIHTHGSLGTAGEVIK